MMLPKGYRLERVPYRCRLWYRDRFVCHVRVSHEADTVLAIVDLHQRYRDLEVAERQAVARAEFGRAVELNRQRLQLAREIRQLGRRPAERSEP